MAFAFLAVNEPCFPAMVRLYVAVILGLGGVHGAAEADEDLRHLVFLLVTIWTFDTVTSGRRRGVGLGVGVGVGLGVGVGVGLGVGDGVGLGVGDGVGVGVGDGVATGQAVGQRGGDRGCRPTRRGWRGSSSGHRCCPR